jgi:DNA-binding NtrC family response regulator
VKLELPPLRQRRSDIPMLAAHFLAKYSKEMNRHVTHVSNAAMRALITHEWRGNVRELENVIERAVIFADGREVRLDDLPFGAAEGDGAAGEDLREATRDFERQHILCCLKRHGWDKTEVARVLGISVSSLYRKLDELGVPKSPASNGQDGSEGSRGDAGRGTAPLGSGAGAAAESPAGPGGQDSWGPGS